MMLSKHLSINTSILVAICLSIGLIITAAAIAQDEADDTPPEIPEFVGSDFCIACHSDQEENIKASPHAAIIATERLGCEECHGPGSIHAENPMEVRPRPIEREDQVTLCGRCHITDEEGNATAPKHMEREVWWLGSHSRNDVACLDCHAGHTTGADERDPEKMLPEEPSDTCKMCHADVVDEEAAHGALFSGLCLDCHDPHAAGGPSKALRKDYQDNCSMCHDPSGEDMTGAHEDYDVTGSDCGTCHNPHAPADTEGLLRSVSHSPFEMRACTMCHNDPDDEDDPLGLHAEEADICGACHDLEELAPENHGFRHAPVEMGYCSACHNPHVGHGEHLFNQKVEGNACAICHTQEVLKTVISASTHTPALDGTCSACHSPHSSPAEPLLPVGVNESCEVCHGEHNLKHPTGGLHVDPRNDEPLDCASCHAPHGGMADPLIDHPQQRELCLSCHKIGA